jgi:hypothetical protein
VLDTIQSRWSCHYCQNASDNRWPATNYSEQLFRDVETIEWCKLGTRELREQLFVSYLRTESKDVGAKVLAVSAEHGAGIPQ